MNESGQREFNFKSRLEEKEEAKPQQSNHVLIIECKEREKEDGDFVRTLLLYFGYSPQLDNMKGEN